MRSNLTPAARLNLVLVILMTLAGWACLTRLPAGAQIATHFALDGTPNAYQPARHGVFLLPAVAALVWLVMAVVPVIDPRGNIGRAPTAYRIMWTAVTGLLAVFQAMILSVALGAHAPGSGFGIVCLGAVLATMGNQLGKLRPNFFIGIRTPWTLSSDAVWDQTHRLGGFTCVAAGLVMIGAGLVIPNPRVMLPLAASAMTTALLVPMAWSYKLWRDEAGAGVRGGNR